MRRSRLSLLVFAMLALGAAMAPGTAAAACPLGPGPIWAEAAAFGVHDTPVEQILARPGTLLGVSNDDWADSYRSRGAETAGWHMQLPAIVGTLSNPKTRAAVLSKIPSLSNLAHRITTCDPPWLALNEMLTVQSPEPIGYGQRRFRENVLLLAKELDARGVRVILFMPRIPHAKTRYRSYWRTLSRYTDYVYEAYTWKTREAIRRSDAGARKYFRDKWTAAVKRLKTFTVHPGPDRTDDPLLGQQPKQRAGGALGRRLVQGHAAQDRGRDGGRAQRAPRDPVVVGLAHEPARGRSRPGQAEGRLRLPAHAGSAPLRSLLDVALHQVDTLVSEC